MLEVLRSGRLSLGPTIDRFEELFAEAVGAPYAAAVSSGTAGLHLLCRIAGLGPGRRGDHVAVLVRRVGELLPLRGRDAGLRRRRPAHVQPRPGRGRGRDHAADEGGRRGRHLRLPVRARPAARALRAARPRADRRRVRGARRRVPRPAGRRPRRRRGLRVLPEQADHDRRGRRRHDALRGDVAAAAARSATRGGPTTAAGSTTRASATTTASTTFGPRSASASWRSSTAILALRAPRSRERYGELLAGRRRASTTPLRRRRRAHAARGSSTSSSSREGIDREAVIAALEADGIGTARYLPCIHLQAYMRERYGFAEGLCPVAEESEPPDARAPVPRAARRRGSGARRRRRSDARWRSTVRAGQARLGRGAARRQRSALEAVGAVTYAARSRALWNVDVARAVVSDSAGRSSSDSRGARRRRAAWSRPGRAARLGPRSRCAPTTAVAPASSTRAIGRVGQRDPVRCGVGDRARAHEAASRREASRSSPRCAAIRLGSCSPSSSCVADYRGWRSASVYSRATAGRGGPRRATRARGTSASTRMAAWARARRAAARASPAAVAADYLRLMLASASPARSRMRATSSSEAGAGRPARVGRHGGSTSPRAGRDPAGDDGDHRRRGSVPTVGG